MPGFFEALEKFKNKEPKKHFVNIDGNNIEVSLKQKLDIQRSGETNYFCQKGPNGIVICKSPIVPKEQQQAVLTKTDKGIKFLDNNPYWPVDSDVKGYKWQIK